MININVPKWAQNKLLDGETVIAKIGSIYATDRRLLNCITRFNFRFLEYEKISDIAFEKYGIGRKFGFILILFLCSLIYIIFVPDLLGYPYKIGDIWVNPFSSYFATPNSRLLGIFSLIGVGVAVIFTIFEFPFRYFQVMGSDFDSEHLPYWRFNVPHRLNGQVNKFIEIVKEELGKNTNK